MRATALATQTVGASRILVRDSTIPRPLRWGGALGLLPVPGPFDELVLVLVGGLLWLFYRERFRAAWLEAGLRGRRGHHPGTVRL